MNDAATMIQKSVKQAARLFHEGNLAGCQLLIGQTLRCDPDNDEALQIAGLLKLRTGNAAEAVDLLEMAREIAPSNPDHHNNLALAYSRVGRYDCAVTCTRNAIHIAPGRQVFWINLGVQLRNKASARPVPAAEREDLLDGAKEAFEKAIAIGPESTSAFANLASLYAERHDMAAAAVYFNRALEIDNSLAGVHVDLSYVYFLSDQPEKAWPHYEHRFAHYPQATRWEKVFPTSKRWDGKTPLEDKRVIVFCEQGCGDGIQFARYIPLLKAKTITICCHDPLKDLLSQFAPTYGMGQKTPEYDVSIPIMSLPFLLGDPPAPVPYITPPQPADLSAYDGTLKVGICWAGNPQHPGDRFRSIPVSEFKRFALPGVTLFSLQKDYRPRKYHDSEEVIDLCKDGPKVVDLSPVMNTFSDTARFIAALDLVITVDTAVLHLAGAMGKETWAFVPYSPDWRWGLSGNKTPTYPSLTLFRQPEKNDWKSALDAAGEVMLDKITTPA